jgi:hypothetical protein
LDVLTSITGIDAAAIASITTIAHLPHCRTRRIAAAQRRFLARITGCCSRINGIWQAQSMRQCVEIWQNQSQNSCTPYLRYGESFSAGADTAVG